MRYRALIAVVFLLTVAALSARFAAIWLSDDYALVYGLYGSPVPSFWEGLSRTPQGVITPNRLLMYWFIGAVGNLGPTTAHVIGIAIHLLCAGLLAGLVWRLFRSPALVVLSTAWFVIAPWVTQPSVWWSSTVTGVSTALMLVAAHCFLSSLSAAAMVRAVWLALACVAVFVALCFYELWLAGLLLFVGIALLVHHNDDAHRQGAAWRRYFYPAAVMAVPFIVWMALVAVIGLRSQFVAERVVLSVPRALVVLASIHLRVANWLIGPDWPALLKMGAEGLSTAIVLIPCVAGLILLVVMLARAVADPVADRLASNGRPAGMAGGPAGLGFGLGADRHDGFPWALLGLAWMMFLSSRLVIIAQGGTSLGSRLNYGAAMAVALAAAGLAVWAWRRWYKDAPVLRWVIALAIGASIALMALGTAGRARHAAQVAQAEAYTITVLDRELTQHPEIRSITIFGTPVPDIGEINYLQEGDMYWLNVVMQYHGHNAPIRAVPTGFPGGPISNSDVSLVWLGTWPQAQLVRAESLGRPK